MINIILFHILFLSLLEIIFYFEYIGPLETKIFKDTFKNLVNHYENEYNDNENIYMNNNQFIIISKYNNNFNISLDGNNSLLNNNELENAKKERKKNNDDLYKEAIYYWVIFLSIIIILGILRLAYKYNKFKKKRDIMRIDSNNSVEMRRMDMNLIRRDVSSYSIGLVDESASANNNISKVEEIKFINYKKIKKYLRKKLVFYTLLGTLIFTSFDEIHFIKKDNENIYLYSVNKQKYFWELVEEFPQNTIKKICKYNNYQELNHQQKLKIIDK